MIKKVFLFGYSFFSTIMEEKVRPCRDLNSEIVCNDTHLVRVSGKPDFPSGAYDCNSARGEGIEPTQPWMVVCF